MFGVGIGGSFSIDGYTQSAQEEMGHASPLKGDVPPTRSKTRDICPCLRGATCPNPFLTKGRISRRQVKIPGFLAPKILIAWILTAHSGCDIGTGQKRILTIICNSSYTPRGMCN